MIDMRKLPVVQVGLDDIIAYAGLNARDRILEIAGGTLDVDYQTHLYMARRI